MSYSAKRNLAVAVGILALTCIAYSNSLNVPFLFDDIPQIVNNQHLRGISNIPRLFVDPGTFSEFAGHERYRPVLLTSFVINYFLSGYRPWSYHVINLVLHSACALLVYLVAGLVLRRQGGGEGWLTPAAAAAVFAVHPIQTDAVTYISGRSALMAGFFVLAAFYCFINFRIREGNGSLPWAASSVLFFALGLLSKEMAVSFLGLTFAYDLIFTWRGKRAAGKGTVAFYAGALLALATYVVVRTALLGTFAADFNKTPAVLPYLLSEARVFPMYLRLLFLPVNQNADYALPLTVSPNPAVIASLALVASMFFLLYRLRRREPAAVFFGLWFFLALGPESSIFPILDVAVEYRLYLASAGLIAAASILLCRLLRSSSSRKVFASVVVLCLCSLTLVRNTAWSSELNLWKDVVGKSPMSPRAHLNLGTALMHGDRCQEAVRELNSSLELDPLFNQRAKVHNNLGLCYSRMDIPEKAVEEYNMAIEADPGLDIAHVNVGRLYYDYGRYDEALDAFMRAKQVNPYRAVTSYMIGRTYAKLGMPLEALDNMKTALRYSPKDFDICLELAVMFGANGMLQEAQEQARETLSLAEDETQRMKARDLLARLGSTQR